MQHKQDREAAKQDLAKAESEHRRGQAGLGSDGCVPQEGICETSGIGIPGAILAPLA